jgi:ribosomal protein S18 acetylase RimI-like enzyme
MLALEGLSIRPYEAGDDEFIARLAEEAFDEFTPRAIPHTLDMVRRYRTLVVLRGQRRIGFLASSGQAGDVFVVQAIAVSRGERGRGVGEHLMREFEELARAASARRLELCTADCNLAALDLFYRRGFRLLRRRPRFYERGQDACILVKDLGVRSAD